MSLKPGEASTKVLRDLEEIMRYYRPTECYSGNAKVECHELALELISKRRTVADVTVCNRRKEVCLSLAENSEVAVVEITGSEVFPRVDVGDYVKAGDTLAYVITGKGEVRSKRSDSEGRVVLLHEDPTSKPLKYFIVLTAKGAEVGGRREG